MSCTIFILVASCLLFYEFVAFAVCACTLRSDEHVRERDSCQSHKTRFSVSLSSRCAHGEFGFVFVSLHRDRNELYLQIESRENKNTINHRELRVAANAFLLNARIGIHTPRLHRQRRDRCKIIVIMGR